jgi:hypothetical protein
MKGRQCLSPRTAPRLSNRVCLSRSTCGSARSRVHRSHAVTSPPSSAAGQRPVERLAAADDCTRHSGHADRAVGLRPTDVIPADDRNADATRSSAADPRPGPALAIARQRAGTDSQLRPPGVLPMRGPSCARQPRPHFPPAVNRLARVRRTDRALRSRLCPRKPRSGHRIRSGPLRSSEQWSMATPALRCTVALRKVSETK